MNLRISVILVVIALVSTGVLLCKTRGFDASSKLAQDRNGVGGLHRKSDPGTQSGPTGTESGELPEPLSRALEDLQSGGRIDSASPIEFPVGPRFFETADSHLARMLEALPALRGARGGKISRMGENHASIHEVRIETDVGGLRFVETMRGFRHSVTLANESIHIEYAWLGDGGAVPPRAQVVLEFKTGPHSGEKLMACLSIGSESIRITAFQWRSGSFSPVEGIPIGLSIQRPAWDLRDSFVRNAPDASFKAFVNW